MSEMYHYIIRKTDEAFYVFPVELLDRFNELLESDSKYSDDLFFEEFSEYAFDNIDNLEFKGIIT